MPKVGIPGVKSASGQMGFTELLGGEYLMEIESCSVKESANSPGHNWSFKSRVISGPAQEDGKSAENRVFFDNVWVMGERHPKFDENKPSIGANTMKALIVASGVKLSGEDIDPKAFEGLQLGIRLRIVMEKDSRHPDKDAKPRARVAEYFPAEDYVYPEETSKPKAKKSKAKTE